MLGAVAIVCGSVALIADSARIARSAVITPVAVECTLDSVSMENDIPDNASDLDELWECTTKNGTAYDLILGGEVDFRPGDLVSLSLRQVPGVKSALGNSLWQVLASKVLQREETSSLAQSASELSGFSFLIIRAEYSDGAKPSKSSSQLKADLERAMQHMREASYGQFPPADTTIRTRTVQMSERWSDVVAEGSSTNARRAIYKKVSEEQDYVYRMIWVPNSPRLFSASAFANNGACPPFASPPTKGKCYSMYRSTGWQLIAHEIGHNLGFHHAPSLIAEDLTSSGSISMYGDDRNIMGSSGTDPGRHYVAPQRIWARWLPSREVKTMTSTSGYFKMSSLQKTTLGSRRRNSVTAVRIPCRGCCPEAPLTNKPLSEQCDGFVYAAYSEGIVALHYMKQDPISRTEAWSRLSNIKSVQGDITVRFCKTVSGDQAYIGVSSSRSGSQTQCDLADSNPLD